MPPLPSSILFTEQGFTQQCNGDAFQFPSDLNSLQFVRYYPGGSGGVYELSDGKSHFMLKISDSESHLKQEILADTLYLRMGASVPRFAVYNDIPQELRKRLPIPQNRLIDGAVLCRLSEKIKGKHPDAKEVSSLLKKDFVLYAYSNWNQR